MRHHDQVNSYQRKCLIEDFLIVPEVQSVIIMKGSIMAAGMADTVLEK